MIVVTGTNQLQGCAVKTLIRSLQPIEAIQSSRPKIIKSQQCLFIYRQMYIKANQYRLPSLQLRRPDICARSNRPVDLFRPSPILGAIPHGPFEGAWIGWFKGRQIMNGFRDLIYFGRGVWGVAGRIIFRVDVDPYKCSWQLFFSAILLLVLLYFGFVRCFTVFLLLCKKSYATSCFLDFVYKQQHCVQASRSSFIMK